MQLKLILAFIILFFYHFIFADQWAGLSDNLGGTKAALKLLTITKTSDSTLFFVKLNNGRKEIFYNFPRVLESGMQPVSSQDVAYMSFDVNKNLTTFYIAYTDAYNHTIDASVVIDLDSGQVSPNSPDLDDVYPKLKVGLFSDDGQHFLTIKPLFSTCLNPPSYALKSNYFPDEKIDPSFDDQGNIHVGFFNMALDNEAYTIKVDYNKVFKDCGQT